jgi:arginyl-tRNA--protein-N-Asp/Glu arginylyltransferase
MMRVHKLLETVKLDDVQIRKVERLIGTRLPSVMDVDFEEQAKRVEEHVGKFKEWFEARKSDTEFLKLFKLYANPREKDETAKASGKLPSDEELFKRLREWPAKSLVAVAAAS